MVEIDPIRRILMGDRDFTCHITSEQLEELRPLAVQKGLRLIVREADGWARVIVEDGNYRAWGPTLM